MSFPAASARPSRETHMVVKAMREFTSLPTFPVPRAPRWNWPRPSASKYGDTRRDLIGVAAHNEDELPVARADGAARQGRFDEVASAAGETSPDGAHGGGGVGGEVDEERAGRRPAQPVLRYRGHDLRRRQGEEGDVGVRRNVLG